jgi:hypothetical protein
MKKYIIILLVLAIGVISWLFIHYRISRATFSTSDGIHNNITVVSNKDFMVYLAGPIVINGTNVPASNVSFTIDPKDK